MSWILEPLRHGPTIALVAALVVSPVAMTILALLVERRPFRPQDQYVAFLYGDIALAASVASGGWAWSDAVEPQRWGIVAAAVLVTALGFGIAQWRHDVTSGRYTVEQALSPTKVWHQLVVIPLLTTWLLASLWIVLARGAWLSIAVWLGGVAVWTACAAYDVRHPKPGHVEFEWSRSGRGRPVGDEGERDGHDETDDDAQSKPER